MTMVMSHFLDAFKAAAEQAEAAEGEFRQEIARRVATFERERAFAFRRLNLMRTIADSVTGAENEDVALACASAALCAKVGWSTDSEARTEVLAHFKPVAEAIFRNLTPSEDGPAESIQELLAEFESWYAQSRQTPFWVLFENYLPETPRVDF